MLKCLKNWAKGVHEDVRLPAAGLPVVGGDLPHLTRAGGLVRLKGVYCHRHILSNRLVRDPTLGLRKRISHSALRRVGLRQLDTTPSRPDQPEVHSATGAPDNGTRRTVSDTIR